MKKLSLLLITVLIITSQTANAQINIPGAYKKMKKEVNEAKQKNIEQEEQGKQEKDYPLLSRFDGAEKVYENITKWEEYKLPVNSTDNYLHWEAYTKLEGKIIRYQYSVSPDNNPAYLLKMYEKKLENSGFKILFAKKGNDIGLSSGAFSEKYYDDLGNSKFGFKYGTSGRDHSFIVGKIKNDGKTIFAAVYISGFDNITLITQDIIEAETIEEQKVIVTIFRGSSVSYDDKMGFDEFFVTTDISPEGKLTTKRIEGNIHHRFCYAPENRSAKEIIINYEEAIKSKGGEILVSASGKEFYKEFSKKRPDHGLTNYEWISFGGYNTYLSAIIPGDKTDHYVIVITSQVEKKLVYSLVIIETKAMEKGFVTAANIDDDMLTKGYIAIYGIHFETGQSVIKTESKATLNIIADYLNSHPDKSFYIVGHTDNVGDFTENKTLSEDRAKAVMNNLISEYNVNAEQLKAYGVSSLSPVESNKTNEGKAKNRRVEIVEQ